MIDDVRLWARETPGQVALRCSGRTWTYAQLDQDVDAWASRLASFGVRRGDRVALLAPNRAEWPAIVFATWRLGAVLVPLNARLTAAELSPQVEKVRAALVLADATLASHVAGARELEEVAALPGDGRVDAIQAGDGELRAILFTSGTTGRSKAAALTAGNFRANARASAANIGGERTDAWLAVLPLFHIGGLVTVSRCAAYGCTLVLQPRFDAGEVNGSIDREGITHTSLVPTGLARVLAERGARRFPSSLRAVLIGGGPVPGDLLARARELGAPVLQTYGLTEASSQVTTERPTDADGTTAGPPLPGLEVRIVDAQGVPVPADRVGELEVRGPTVMAGYDEDPVATREALRDGWLKTKDLGALDGRGRLRVFSRRTDLIVTGGENVYPAEVEAVLLSLPGVRDAAVGAIDDTQWGQVPGAAVVLEGPFDQDALERGCRARLAGFKVPRRFVRVGELPRNAGGKVDRAALRALLAP